MAGSTPNDRIIYPEPDMVLRERDIDAPELSSRLRRWVESEFSARPADLRPAFRKLFPFLDETGLDHIAGLAERATAAMEPAFLVPDPASGVLLAFGFQHVEKSLTPGLRSFATEIFAMTEGGCFALAQHRPERKDIYYRFSANEPMERWIDNLFLSIRFGGLNEHRGLGPPRYLNWIVDTNDWTDFREVEKTIEKATAGMGEAAARLFGPQLAAALAAHAQHAGSHAIATEPGPSLDFDFSPQDGRGRGRKLPKKREALEREIEGMGPARAATALMGAQAALRYQPTIQGAVKTARDMIQASMKSRRDIYSLARLNWHLGGVGDPKRPHAELLITQETRTKQKLQRAQALQVFPFLAPAIERWTSDYKPVLAAIDDGRELTPVLETFYGRKASTIDRLARSLPAEVLAGIDKSVMSSDRTLLEWIEATPEDLTPAPEAASWISYLKAMRDIARMASWWKWNLAVTVRSTLGKYDPGEFEGKTQLLRKALDDLTQVLGVIVLSAGDAGRPWMIGPGARMDLAAAARTLTGAENCPQAFCWAERWRIMAAERATKMERGKYPEARWTPLLDPPPCDPEGRMSITELCSVSALEQEACIQQNRVDDLIEEALRAHSVLFSLVDENGVRYTLQLKIDFYEDDLNSPIVSARIGMLGGPASTAPSAAAERAATWLSEQVAALPIAAVRRYREGLLDVPRLQRMWSDAPKPGQDPKAHRQKVAERWSLVQRLLAEEFQTMELSAMADWLQSRVRDTWR